MNAEFSTYDDLVGAKGSNGTMFTLQAVRDVEINSFYTYLRSNDIDLVQVYTRPGSYNGFESSDVGWERVFDQSIRLNGLDQVTELGFSDKVIMTAGQFQSFYVYSPSNLAYRSENVQEGDLVKGDDSFNFYAGIAIAYGRFGDGQIFSPRVYSGLISYNTITLDSPTEPTALPTWSSPTVRPSNEPSNSPSKHPISSSPTASTSSPTTPPTGSPVAQCGDGFCDGDEHSNTCPLDCRNIAYWGASSGNKGSEGIMFYVKARRDIIVTSFDVYGVSASTSPFQVYTKADSYQGSETTSSDWNLFYDNPSLSLNGRFTLTSLGDFANGVLIPAGETVSFYLYTPSLLMYAVGTDSTPYSFNDDLELYEGIGVTGGLFADGEPINIVVDPRVFAGIIK